ncbi:MAG TPA: hypothetical protein VMN56_05365 [Casimicrobiaceae bacterium]|nr:hypothetical protein [Casimicrobiaceae bacterium]
MMDTSQGVHGPLMAAIFAVALSCASAQAATTIYGFEFGKPIALPECPLIPNMPQIGGRKDYQITPSYTCRWDPQEVNGEPALVTRIIWSAKESPLAVRSWQANAIELHGGLAGFDFFTNGVSSQSIVLEQLTEKFGPPTSISHERVQNLAGAAFDSITALWRGGEVDVTFYGTRNRLDRGEVFIDLPEVTAMRGQAVRALSGPKM